MGFVKERLAKSCFCVGKIMDKEPTEKFRPKNLSNHSFGYVAYIYCLTLLVLYKIDIVSKTNYSIY